MNICIDSFEDGGSPLKWTISVFFGGEGGRFL